MKNTSEWHRANIRKAFVKAQVDLKGIDHWDENDDQFTDLIDNRIKKLTGAPTSGAQATPARKEFLREAGTSLPDIAGTK